MVDQEILFELISNTNVKYGRRISSKYFWKILSENVESLTNLQHFCFAHSDASRGSNLTNCLKIRRKDKSNQVKASIETCCHSIKQLKSSTDSLISLYIWPLTHLVKTCYLLKYMIVYCIIILTFILYEIEFKLGPIMIRQKNDKKRVIRDVSA